MRPFPRRTYTPSEFVSDLRELWRRRRRIRPLMKEQSIPHDFRERIMLAVTQVNDCRYCSWYHSRLALSSGIPEKEVDSLLCGELEDSPQTEIMALHFATHWAETNGHPNHDAEKNVRDCYGDETFEDIITAMRLIRMGNLSGNTWDFFLYRISCGRLGN